MFTFFVQPSGEKSDCPSDDRYAPETKRKFEAVLQKQEIQAFGPAPKKDPSY